MKGKTEFTEFESVIRDYIIGIDWGFSDTGDEADGRRQKAESKKPGDAHCCISPGERSGSGR